MLTVAIVLLLVLLMLGAIPAWGYRGGNYGYAPVSFIGLLFIALLIALLLYVL